MCAQWPIGGAMPRFRLASPLRTFPALLLAVGLLPAAISSGIGSQVQKPLAIVVVGGMMLAPFVILIALPVLSALFSRRTRPEMAAETAPEPAE